MQENNKEHKNVNESNKVKHPGKGRREHFYPKKKKRENEQPKAENELNEVD